MKQKAVTNATFRIQFYCLENISANPRAVQDLTLVIQILYSRIGKGFEGVGVVKLSLNLEHSSRTRGPSPMSPYNAINADSNAYRK